MEKKKTLTKGKDKLIAGVCSGIAEYFGLDVNLVRLAYVLLTLIAPNVFIPFCIVAALILPDSEDSSKNYVHKSKERLFLLILFILLLVLVFFIFIFLRNF